MKRNDTNRDSILSRELSDDELYAVSGGQLCGCGCYGTGEGGTKDRKCKCIMSGNGNYDNGDPRCVCVEIGYGFSKD